MAKFIYYINNVYESKTYIRAHFHKNYELVYIVKGSAISRLKNITSKVLRENGPSFFTNVPLDENSQKIEIKEGSFIIYPPYYTHDEKHEDSGNVIAIDFNLDSNEGIFPVFSDVDKDDTIINLLNKITEEMKHKKIGYVQMIEAYIEEIMIHIKRMFSFNEENISLIDQVIKHIDDYFASKIDINALAQMYGYSADYLRVLFKNKTGQSPKNYIQDKRINLAKEQILNTNLSLKTISVNCGYDDYLQFSAYFKKKLGVSPVDYKKEYKEKI